MSVRSTSASKRHQRQERTQLRELARRMKEQAKLSALEQARLEVEAHEGELAVLLSVHKEQVEQWDWDAIAATLPPVEPRSQRHRELAARQFDVLASAGLGGLAGAGNTSSVEEARQQDEREYQLAVQGYSQELDEWDERKSLAHRILRGDCDAFRHALTDINPLADASDLCAAVRFEVVNRRLVECAITVRGAEIIPAEAKALTAGGKVSVKPMPKKRFHEIFQDYVCGCVLRLASEVFGILPVDTVLITAGVDAPSRSTGVATEVPVLSVAIERIAFSGLELDSLDPSDAMELFLRRGDVKSSRKTGDFVAITPLRPADLPLGSADAPELAATIAKARLLREGIEAQLASLAPLSPSMSPAR